MVSIVRSLYCALALETDGCRFPTAHTPRESLMKALPKKQMRKNRGQGMTEYIIIVALIAIAAIGVISLFGDNIRKLFGASADALAGNTDVTSSASSRSTSLETKNLATFGQNNAAF